MASNTVPIMSRKLVLEVIKFSILNSGKIKLPIMIWGWHGVGKTQLVKDVCEELGYNLKILHLATQDIIDLIGRPVDVARIDPSTGDRVHVQDWCVPSWLQDAKEDSAKNGKPTVFFLDEFNRGPRIVLNAMLPFLIEGLMHTHRIDEKDAIVAACNPPSEDYEVNELEDKAQLDRLGHVVLKTTVQEYIKYLKSTGMDETTINVISNNRSLVEVPKIDPGIELKPSMRSVDYVMRKVSVQDSKWIKDIAAPVIHSYLGETFKDLWLAERSKYNETISMDMLFDYENNKREITKGLTSVIDGIETVNISVLEKITENIISYFEEKGRIELEDCKWFVPFLNNEKVLDEEIKKLFSKEIIEHSLKDPDVNKQFNMLVNKDTFNKSGIELW